MKNTKGKIFILILFLILSLIISIIFPINNSGVVLKVRIPRIILSFLVGGMLSVSGALTQSVLKNPLASPYTLGVSSGASLGVSLIMVFSINISYVFYPIVGFVFSFLTVVFVISFSKKLDKTLSNLTIVLIGMVISLFLNSFTTLITALKRESLTSLFTFQMGGFSGRGYKYIILILPFLIISMVIALRNSRELDILTFSDDMGKSMGVETEKVKIKILMASSILTGVCIGVSGVIGFIDLIVPNIVRKIFSSRHGIIVPISFIFGGGLMMIFDVISRSVIYPSEIPVGVITTFVGTIIFCYIFFKNARRF